MMKFANSYFENEIRDGFLIPGMVKRSWAVQMEVLDTISQICKKNGLRWYADYGTLMGAVRHGGFVPWDDDMDICMFRKDFDRLYSIVKRELPADYTVLCLDNNVEYEDFMLRITKGAGINLSNDYLKENHGFPYCAGIDIFPMDYLFADGKKEEERFGRLKELQCLAGEAKKLLSKDSERMLIKQIEDLSGYKINAKMNVFQLLLRAIDHVFKEANGEKSNRIAVMAIYMKSGRQIRPIELYEHCIEVKFENDVMAIPARYDEVLRLEYGNWGVANRKGGLHNYPFYKEQENMVLNANGDAPYRFVYPAVREDMKTSRRQHFLEVDQCGQTIAAMSTAHEMMAKLAEGEQFSVISDMCQSYQEMAVTVGMYIEEKKGEGLSIISKLEKYCEVIFAIYEAAVQNDVVLITENNILAVELLTQISQDYCEIFSGMSGVLFVLDRYADWEILKGTYEKEIVCGDREVSVLPLPYYEREDDGSIGEQHWEIDCFPSDVNIVDYRKTDIKKKHFARVYFTNPYDEYQSGATITPFAYASELSKITDELILTVNLTVSKPDDEKTKENLKHYVLTPGVCNADRIFVASDELKNVIEQILSDVNDQKNIEITDELSVEFKDKNRKDGKKRIAFFVSIADYYAKSFAIFEWIRKKLDVFSNNKEKIILYMVESEYLQSSFLNEYREYTENYKEIVNDVEKSGWGCVVSEKEAMDMTHEFDGFYGSAGILLNKCVQNKVPSMISNMELI